MTFTWPLLLWTLLLLPMLVVLYVWLLRRRKKNAVAFANLALVRQAATRRSTWKRHLPPALMLLALGLMLVAAARPVAVVHLPSNKQIIMLAMDVSGSMRATVFAAGDGERVRAEQLVPTHDNPDDIYKSNIQIAELNALNACIAVMLYKKHMGFYVEDEPLFNLLFGVSDMRASRQLREV